MNDLKNRFDEETKNIAFTVFELAGFQANPILAIKAGMAIGYRMAMDDAIGRLEACESAPQDCRESR